jgi:RNA polymerase-interacting CarD/CdnL/TRCF family regulator
MMARTKFKSGDRVVYAYAGVVKRGTVEEVKKVEHLGNKVCYWVRFDGEDKLSGIIYAKNLHKPLIPDA